jgi:peptidoglycan/xylan/chitin deacetylase (PgdA/CDA1 family)
MPLTRRALLRGTAAAAAAAAAAACSSGTTANRATPRTSDGPTPATGSPPPASATSATPAARPHTAGEVRHGDRASGRVALTFHGAGEVALAEQLLGLLERRDVQATVMAVGTWLEGAPQMARRITRGGHDLGNHTLHHYPMRDLGARTAFDEVEGCARVLRRTAGGPGTWFRASGTQSTTPTIRRAAARAGYARCVSYDVDGLDWRDPPAPTVVHAVLDGARGGSIISLHLGHPVTVAALPDILDGLRARSLQPVTLTQLLG